MKALLKFEKLTKVRTLYVLEIITRLNKYYPSSQLKDFQVMDQRYWTTSKYFIIKTILYTNHIIAKKV